MLPIDTETICFLIAKAREFSAKETVVIPETPYSPSEDWARQILADHLDDPCYLEFTATVNDLEIDQKIALVALMWLGRGDYDKSEWEEALAMAKAESTTPTASYLLGTPLVADYLEEGLAQLNYSCNE